MIFDRAPPRRFDLVVGADGLHSAVRRLTVGPEAEFTEHLGMYVATAKLGIPIERDDVVIMYNEPGKAVCHGGPATLGASLDAPRHDIPAALARYESTDRAAIRPRQRGVLLGSHLLIPRSRLGMTLRDRLLLLVRWR